MKEYRLIGPNEGKTINLGNFNFVEGRLRVEDKEVQFVEPIITRFYGAVPAADFERLKREQAEAARKAEAEAKAAADKDKK